MRRPVMYLAGMLLATGASLALAGPASAAPGHTPCPYGQSYYAGYPSGFGSDYEQNSFNGIQLLGNQGSGNQGGLIPILSPFS
ncbi:hypothetical protein [Paractinoplanes rishiriensis]|uniref:Uncharacterized protein n=1 Tax=Paractinoplanes rishiriensis TaxID=1050105 RepID=A0A919MPJ3_9ACTN|nr:hypothetical protein [Actinoplanes rishiriensis]GIE95136.1 hypothetical protein Ari01nite_26010 [Actinoplanes rishiriensis]